MGIAVARRNLNHAQGVAAKPKAHGFGIHGERRSIREQAFWQVAVMEMVGQGSLNAPQNFPYRRPASIPARPRRWGRGRLASSTRAWKTLGSRTPASLTPGCKDCVAVEGQWCQERNQKLNATY